MALKTYNAKRNFKKTAEPQGRMHKSDPQLIFVVQKHHASHLHYDFRLEMGGVLKSWAVPKGPSLDPSVKRLAMEVEDHPYDYKDFEGKIPEGNYGAGDVIVWDNGLYASAKKGAGEKELLRDYRKGRLSFVLLGKKLKGEFALVRTPREDKSGRRNQWLLMKADDEYATEKDITDDVVSVISEKTLPEDEGKVKKIKKKSEKEEIKKELRKGKKDLAQKPKRTVRAKMTEEALAPMLATLVDTPFNDPEWIFEIKWDGYRLSVRKENGRVVLISRNGIDVTKKYSRIAAAFEK
ncbi:MAG: DNA ligase, partial [Patescibacteria group bacterium]|nr:DNA ligase [Patescibacteria group bacterium]